MTIKAPGVPPLPDDLLSALRCMRMPYLRAAAPEFLSTAKAQRWDPAEVLRVLIAEEIRGRDEATRRVSAHDLACRCAYDPMCRSVSGVS